MANSSGLLSSIPEADVKTNGDCSPLSHSYYEYRLGLELTVIVINLAIIVLINVQNPNIFSLLLNMM